jgi:hypothetical protein
MSKLEKDLKVLFWKDYWHESIPGDLTDYERFELISEDFEAVLLNLYPNPKDITRDGIGNWYDNAKEFIKQVEDAEAFVSACIAFNALHAEQVWSFIEEELGWKLDDRNRD